MTSQGGDDEDIRQRLTLWNRAIYLSWISNLPPDCYIKRKKKSLKLLSDFPGGPVVENPLAKARDTAQSLVWEDSTCLGATKPMPHHY